MPFLHFAIGNSGKKQQFPLLIRQSLKIGSKLFGSTQFRYALKIPNLWPLEEDCIGITAIPIMPGAISERYYGLEYNECDFKIKASATDIQRLLQSTDANNGMEWERNRSGKTSSFSNGESKLTITITPYGLYSNDVDINSRYTNPSSPGRVISW